MAGTTDNCKDILATLMSRNRSDEQFTHGKDQHCNENGSTISTRCSLASTSAASNLEGRYCFRLGESITRRYQILKKLGEGTFGQVLECWDKMYQENVAIKMTRNTWDFTKAANMEIQVLNVLASHDPSGVRGCLRLKRWFNHQGHLCIVSERLGPSLCDVLNFNNFRPFSIHQVCQIGKQILFALAYVHENYIIHTDLKTQNVLVVPPDFEKEKATEIQVRLIDFGSAVFFKHEHNRSIVTTRNYRAPEIILGLQWSYPCDIWSVGCILVELITGYMIFEVDDDDLKHLEMMKMILGPMPSSMMKPGQYSKEKIQGMGLLPPLKDLIQKRVSLNPEIAGEFLQLLEGMLKYDPDSRLTAAQALSHPFFRSASLPCSPAGKMVELNSVVSNTGSKKQQVSSNCLRLRSL